MKFTIPKYKLETLILMADSIIEHKISSIIFSNIILEVKENKLFISASDSQIVFKAIEEIEVVEDGKVLINSKKLSDIIKVLPDDEIQFTSDENYNITINPINSTSNLKYNLKGIIEEDYNLEINIDQSSMFEYNIEQLKEMVNKISFATADDDPVYSLNGIYLEVLDNKFSMVSTDNKRLCYNYQFENEPNQTLVVPKKFFNIINKIKTTSENILLGIQEKKISAKIDNLLIESYLLEPNYPKYKNIFPKSIEYNVTINTNEFKNKLKAISALIENNKDPITFEFQTDKLHIYTKNSEFGNAEDNMNIEYRQDSKTINMSYNNINDFIKVINSENFTMEFGEKARIILMKPDVQDDNYTFNYLSVTVQN